MPVVYHRESREFHLFNQTLSYVIHIAPGGVPVTLYCGARVRDQKDFSYLLHGSFQPLTAYAPEDTQGLSMQHLPLEYPAFGSGDYRCAALDVRQENGSRTLRPAYTGHRIVAGKPKLNGLPATYVEVDDEADTLEMTLTDTLSGLTCNLIYPVFTNYAAIARSVRIENNGAHPVSLLRAFSLSLDFPDDDFEMVTLSGAWSREREPVTARLTPGTHAVQSISGASSAEHNPFVMLKRPLADEHGGDVYGFSLVYSGNHYTGVQVDTFGRTRVSMGIHHEAFCWQLAPGASFQTPEAVLAFSADGINGMSQTFHRLYRTRLARGYWRDRPRPLVINNWEATGPNFTQDKLLKIAEAGHEIGLDLFVLDDGWFGNRDDDKRGLGDWFVPAHSRKLPHGIDGLAERMNAVGMQFGLWIEPEMVNRDSELFRTHPDWILSVPSRAPLEGRHQYVLDYSRPEVVDALYASVSRLLDGGRIAYVKWDMNRYITDCYSAALPPQRQGEVFHRYILGVYSLYERLTAGYPKVLFESCASGGARFDPGMLYYAPQTWTSDNTDAAERVKIQYGTSMVYPLSAISAHISEIPNQQVGRSCSLVTRGNVAMFGIYGCELDLTEITDAEKEQLIGQVEQVKRYETLIREGEFYRLLNPYQGSACAWMVVSQDKRTALVGYYRLLVRALEPAKRLTLRGLNPELNYHLGSVEGTMLGGDALMRIGIEIDTRAMTGQGGDFSSVVFELRAE
jgi:alpha-galactosidase